MSTTQIKTIAKNRKPLIDAILNASHKFTVYSLSNSFNGELMDGRESNILPPADWMRKELKEGFGTKLTANGNGHFTIHVHSNLWFEFQINPELVSADALKLFRSLGLVN